MRAAVAIGFIILAVAFLCLLSWGQAELGDQPPEERHYSFTNITPGPERPVIAAVLVVAGLVAAVFTFRAAGRYDNARAQGQRGGDRADCARM